MKKTSIALALLLAAVIHLPLYAFNMGGRKKHHSNYSIPVGLDLTQLELSDGTYQGTADGFRPQLTVEVTVKGGKVTQIEVVDHNEVGPQYYMLPIDVIPEAIVKDQQTDIDAVSGATATSKAIMAAVENALKTEA